jgi:type IV secretory pathway TraG/TraD family ATPase VirD4
LLVVLDEAAHIAPLPELDGLAATCASHGIQLVTVWQDLAHVGYKSAT